MEPHSDFSGIALKTVVFMGRPGSGKGTQARLLAQSSGYEYFGTGEIFRRMRTEDTLAGHKVAETIDNGNLMPHWFASYLVVQKILNTSLDQGLVFDGSNRTLPEAELFYDVTSWIGRTYRVVYLDVSEETIRSRINLRTNSVTNAVDRHDDKNDVLGHRISEYDRHTAAALTYLHSLGLVISIDGERSIEEIQADVLAELSKISAAPIS